MQNNNNTLTFSLNQKIICPSHGLGHIIDIIDKKVLDNVIKCYKIYFKNDSLTSFIPVGKIKVLGLRKLCSKEIALRVFSVLAKPSKVTKGIWSKRAQEYDAKMSSGSILLTAEIVKDLFNHTKDASRSYSERIVYEDAFSRVQTEISEVLGLEEEEAEKRMIKVMSKVNSTKKERVKEDESDFDDDLENFENEDVA